MSIEVPKKKVVFKEEVEKRIITTGSEEEEVVDKKVKLHAPDMSKPVYIPVEYDKEEKEVREKLVGCIPAFKKRRPDFARMYGCGKSVVPLDKMPSIEELEEDKWFDEPPKRVIVAHPVDQNWFTISSKP